MRMTISSSNMQTSFTILIQKKKKKFKISRIDHQVILLDLIHCLKHLFHEEM
jgi:hypothetical protein